MRWGYKTVLYELKKEGLLGSSFIDESEIEESLNEFGRAGWELVSIIDTKDGLIAVFKQLLDIHSAPFKVKRSEVTEEPLMRTVVPVTKFEPKPKYVPEPEPEPEAEPEFDLEEELYKDELEDFPEDKDYAEDDAKEPESPEETEDTDDSDTVVGSIRIE